MAISIKNYVAGLNLPNIHKYPYFAVSNTSPGVQMADVFAHLLSKWIQGNTKLRSFYGYLKDLQWVSEGSPKRYGIHRFNEVVQGKVITYTTRKKWI